MSRHLIYVPELNPNSFVFMFVRADTGRSYSVRDYSSGVEVVRYAHDFPWTAGEVLAMARRPGCHLLPAPVVPVSDWDFWIRHTEDANRTHLGRTEPIPVGSPPRGDEIGEPRFPILDLERLRQLPKARKAEDMHRMLRLPNSEDYVTWNAFALLRRSPTEVWWPALLQRLSGHSWLPSPEDPPEVELWRTVPSPRGYEQASRARMAASDNPERVARAADSRPVEGDSEIDVALSGSGYLVFCEAKLHSDISLDTTYDPTRNQIIRNIDCLLEEAGDRRPLFWMLVPSLGPGRRYTQLLELYRSRPGEAATLLPHRNPESITLVIEDLVVGTWTDLLELVRIEPDDEAATSILAELRRRTAPR